MTDWISTEDHPPTEYGWYAVLKCWDAEEGVFPGAAKWEGRWVKNEPIISRSPNTFASEEEADTWAHEHDPDEF